VATAASDMNRRWHLFMHDYMATPIDRNGPVPLRQLEEVFRLD
jgi:L-rhamnose mutarotase